MLTKDGVAWFLLFAGHLANNVSGQYLMVIGGYSPTTDLVEVISLYPDDQFVPECMQNLAPFPFPVYHGAGGVTVPGGNPLICAGFNENLTDESDVCLAYDFGANAWAETGSMPHGAMFFSGYDFHPSWGLVVSGGWADHTGGPYHDVVISTRYCM